MLKKLLMFSLAVLFVGTQVGLAMAANPDTGPGCGLGKLAWSDYKGQKEIAPQVMMATTNGTFGDNLSQEMSQGQGEHLASLATLMGIPAEHQGTFFAMTQERYISLVKAGEASPVAMVKALNEAVAGHPVLARASAQ